ncbi:hypothetical protein LP7551_03293 [Roseibium album]|nr:hypothetical protein LP7551_03293 [Roseibium album]
MPKLGYVVYKLTFPNGKIYIGKDIGGEGHSLRYVNSPEFSRHPRFSFSAAVRTRRVTASRF